MVALALAPACSDNPVPHGSPVLLSVYWQLPRTSANVFCAAPLDQPATDGQCLVWTKEADAGTVMEMAPAAPTQLNLVFDRVLDGSKIETTVTDGGVSQQQPAMTPPITVTDDETGNAPVLPDPPTPPSPFSLTVWYNSAHLQGASPTSSYVYGRELPAFPSGTTLTFHLDKTLLLSVYGEPIDAPDTISVTIAPFALGSLIAFPADPKTDAGDEGATDAGSDAADAATGGGTVSALPPPGAPVPPDYQLPLQFNSVPVDVGAMLAQYIDVSSGGAPVAFELVPDPIDPTLVRVTPPTRAVWATGAPIAVTVKATLPDRYGKTLGVATTVSFLPCVLDATGKSCSTSDAGQAADAGQATDAGQAADVVQEIDAGVADLDPDAGD